MADEIRIKVGVALDANASAILAPVAQAAKRTGKAVAQEMDAGGKAGAAAMSRGMKGAEKAFKELGRVIEREEKRKQAIIQQSSAMAGRLAAKQASDEIREARRATAERVRLEKAAQREIEKARKLQERRAEAAERFFGGGGGAIGIGRRAGIRVGRGTAVAYGLAGRALSSATSFGMDLAHGIGYETDLGSHVRAAKEQRKTATEISSSGYVPGTELVDPDKILSQARAVGNATGTDASEALRALQGFVAKTGDLKTGMESLRQMAVLSKATGSSLDDMANASADVSNAMGDIPNKSQAVYAVMKQIAGQGKLGAVEIRDLASQMGKIAASAGRFTGDVGKNIATLGALTQITRAHGGAVSSQQAATSVVAFTSGFSKKSNFKNWTNFRAPVPGHKGKFEGLNPFTDSTHTALSDPMTLIKAALVATRGDQTKLATLFPSTQGMRTVAGLSKIYTGAYKSAKGDDEAKNAAGIAAVTKEFEDLQRAQLDEVEVQRAFTAQMQLGDAKANTFNNKMTAVAEKLETALLPAVDSVGAGLVDLASGITGAVDWFTKLTGGQDSKDKEHNATSDKAFGAATENTDAHNRALAPKLNPKTGKMEVSGQAFDVVQNDQKTRGELIGKMRAQIATEKADVSEASRPGAFGKVGDWIGKTFDKAVGHQTKDQTNEAARNRIEREQSVLAVLTAKQDETNRILQKIAEGQTQQTTVISRPDPPTARPEPGANPNADTGG